MKRTFKIFNVFFVIMIIFSGLCFATTENNIIAENIDIMNISEDVEKYEEINSDVFITKENIIVDEKVNGSLYLIGNNIKVSSPEVNGNVFAIGDEIEITGKVNGSIYTISSDIEILGKTEDLYVITNDLEIVEKASCRDVKVLGNSIEIEGKIDRDLYAISNIVNIENKEGASIGGTLYATGKVTGTTDKVNAISKMDVKIEKNDKIIGALVKTIKIFYFISTSIFALVVIGVLILCIKKSDTYISDIKEMFATDAIHGLGYWLISLLIVILLSITVLGIPLAILFACVIWLLFWKINIPVATIEISKILLKNNSNSKWMIFIVAFGVFLAIQIISIIPVLGTIFKYIISLYGFGFMYRKLFKRDKESKIEVEIIE